MISIKKIVYLKSKRMEFQIQANGMELYHFVYQTHITMCRSCYRKSCLSIEFRFSSLLFH